MTTGLQLSSQAYRSESVKLLHCVEQNSVCSSLLLGKKKKKKKKKKKHWITMCPFGDLHVIEQLIHKAKLPKLNVTMSIQPEFACTKL